MPEYLAPGVYVEETSFRAKSIEGVSTTTTGFVGPARFGPTDIEPELITSLLEFERTYGNRLQLKYNLGTNLTHNYLWHAVRAFFEESNGGRVYVSRVFEPIPNKDGRAQYTFPKPEIPLPDSEDKITVKPRSPEIENNFNVNFTLKLGSNIFKVDVGTATVTGLKNGDVVLIADRTSTFIKAALPTTFASIPAKTFPLSSEFWSIADHLVAAGSPSMLGFFIARQDNPGAPWRFETGKSSPFTSINLSGFDNKADFDGLEIQPVTLTVTLKHEGGGKQEWEGIALDPSHLNNTNPDWIFEQFNETFSNKDKPIVITKGANLKTGLDVLAALNQASQNKKLLSLLVDDQPSTVEIPLTLATSAITVRSRFPGEAGNFRVRFTLRLGQNIFGVRKNENKTDKAFVAGLNDGDVVLIADQMQPFLSTSLVNTNFATLPAFSPPISDFWTQPAPDKEGKQASILGFFIARFDTNTQAWRFETGTTTPYASVPLNGNGSFDSYNGLEIRIVTLAVTVIGEDGVTHIWEGLPFDPNHYRGQTPDSVFDKFSEKPSNLADARQLPIVINKTGIETGLDVLRVLNGKSQNNSLLRNLVSDTSNEDSRSVDIILENGNDGILPSSDTYNGHELDFGKTGLVAFEDLEDISIIAAPGSTQGLEDNPDASKRAQAIMLALISHAERMRYRIAVLDSGNNQTISQVRALRAKLDSKYAALYFPWIKVLDPVTRTEIALPPSGFVAGIYARNDKERAVYKAPANEVVRGALSFEMMLNKSQQEVLNPEGINCFRFFEGRGMRLWGARTISSDPEWKYVNLRRYFAYLERSIDKGTQWAVFEPNGDQLWANVRRTISDFLFNEWQNGALLGDKPEKSYFVKCDRSTMSQNDLDNGRLICLIGVAPLRPAEFVIFRIGQWTADRKV